MSNTLTAKEDHFCRLIALEGFTQHKAYLTAYDVSPDTKPTSITEQASLLANIPHISSTIQELRDATVAPIVASLIQRKVSATDIMNDSTAKNHDRLAANRLIGDYEQDFVKRVEVNLQGVVVNIEGTVEEIDAMLEIVRAKKALLKGTDDETPVDTGGERN